LYLTDRLLTVIFGTPMLKDPHFRVEVVAQTPNPNRAIWVGQHQCVSENFALDDPIPETEEACGKAIVKHLLPFAHWSPCEHACITFNIGGFGHRVMQQFTRHRIGVSPSVQSFRYTGERVHKLGTSIIEAMNETDACGVDHLLDELRPSIIQDVNTIFYQRPIGVYRDREGRKYEQTSESYRDRTEYYTETAMRYADLIDAGWSYEDAAEDLPMGTRQDFVATFNVRSLCAFMDRRAPANAQLEIQALSVMIWEHFKVWVPEIAQWYEANRLGKNKLAP